MAEILPIILVLLAITAGSTLIAEKLVIPEPVVMAAVGIGLSFIPNFPTVQLNPRVVLLGFLPPLVYIAAAQLPWDEFRSNIRPILSLAVGLVAATSVVVATVSHCLIPGLGWAEAFALGAIVSPTDPVASTAISERLGVPRRLTAITEGEGLVNDAIALTLLHVATTAIASSAFSPSNTLLRLLVIVIGETAYGLLVGWAAANRYKEPRACPLCHAIEPCWILGHYYVSVKWYAVSADRPPIPIYCHGRLSRAWNTRSRLWTHSHGRRHGASIRLVVARRLD